LIVEKIRIGVVGCGYWGPNHIRNFDALRSSGADMAMAADLDPERRAHIAAAFPSLEVVPDAAQIIANPEIDAVVIATPAVTHFAFTQQALEAGKHVLVEKPFAMDVGDATMLANLAERNGLVLAVGHIFEYAASVNRIQQLIASGELGTMRYIRSLRVNLGLFQKDINVLWDLAPHDVSILRYVLGRMPTAVHAVGNAHVNPGVEDVVSLTLLYEDMMANIIVSWLDPRKMRNMTFVGDRRMLVYDDVSSNEKLRIYDKGVDYPKHYDSFGEFQYSYRYGDIVIPRLDEYEPMTVQSEHFLDCIKYGKRPRADADSGSDVTRVLAAAEISLQNGGELVEVDMEPNLPGSGQADL
jgi:predicted dehydrogenase